MDEYFGQKCVTSDVVTAPLAAVSTWSSAHRCECVMVQENAHASGASRAVLASIIKLTVECRKTQRVAVYALEPPRVVDGSAAPHKLVVMDFSSDWECLEAAFSAASPLLNKMESQLEKALATVGTTEASPSARPNVVVVDSLNVLLEMYPLARILAWLRQLRRDPRIGSVIFRLSAAAALAVDGSASSSIVQTLAHEATAVVQVETPASLRAYPILAKERRREIPKRMHGMVLLLRKKKNGRTSESVEYFRVSNGQLTYSSPGGDSNDASSTITPRVSSHNSNANPRSPAATAPPPPQAATTIGTGKALPVRADEVSFNLSISADEEKAKRSVELPYMHQGGGGSGSDGTGALDGAFNNLLIIDDDDPDWDDDDLDDDLDI